MDCVILPTSQIPQHLNNVIKQEVKGERKLLPGFRNRFDTQLNPVIVKQDNYNAQVYVFTLDTQVDLNGSQLQVVDEREHPNI